MNNANSYIALIELSRLAENAFHAYGNAKKHENDRPELSQEHLKNVIATLKTLRVALSYAGGCINSELKGGE